MHEYSVPVLHVGTVTSENIITIVKTGINILMLVIVLSRSNRMGDMTFFAGITVLEFLYADHLTCVLSLLKSRLGNNTPQSKHKLATQHSS